MCKDDKRRYHPRCKVCKIGGDLARRRVTPNYPKIITSPKKNTTAAFRSKNSVVLMAACEFMCTNLLMFVARGADLPDCIGGPK